MLSTNKQILIDLFSNCKPQVLNYEQICFILEYLPEIPTYWVHEDYVVHLSNGKPTITHTNGFGSYLTEGEVHKVYTLAPKYD